MRLLALIGGTAALTVAAVAWAAPVTIPSADDYALELDAEGSAVFDVSQPPDSYNQECASGNLGDGTEDDVGFSPANDVTSDDGSSDQFDGGLILSVGDRIFEDQDQTGDLVGEQLTVGPTKLKGLRVKRIETGLPGSPTLRSLIKLKNKNKHNAKKRTLTWESDVGADGSEVVRDSSSGDSKLSGDDRWLVFADSATTPSDPVGTLVLYGKGKDAKQTQVLDGIADQNGCVKHTIRAKVPPKSSRYLLFFTEAHDDAAGASTDAAKFDKKKPDGGVLDGLKKSVKKKVLNWDLVKND